jgi:hypothetical protein
MVKRAGESEREEEGDDMWGRAVSERERESERAGERAGWARLLGRAWASAGVEEEKGNRPGSVFVFLFQNFE